MDMGLIPLNPGHVLLLTGFLGGLGKVLKEVPHMPNRLIPLVLAVTGGLVAGWMNGWEAVPAVAGACCGLMSTGAHQVVTQLLPKEKKDEDEKGTE